MCIYTHISYIYRGPASAANLSTANLRTKILDRRGFDSSTILSVRGGILMSIGKHQTSGSFKSSDLSRDNLSREIGCRYI